MATLDIRPHSRRVSVWAVAAMAVIAAGAFAEGLGRSLSQGGVSPFPPPQPAALRDTIAEATPAPALQVAPREPVRHAAAPDAGAESADTTATAADASAAPLDVPPVVTAPPVAPPAAPAVASDEAPH